MAVIIRYANQCIGYLQTIKITDIIDILIIAFVLYRVFLLVRRTQAGNVLKGILVLLLALAVSYEFNLHVLTFILSNAVEIGLLALIVLFQPEIRRFLGRMGGDGFLRLFSVQPQTSQTEQAIRQTVEAFRTMSQEHTGALVVFERRSILDEYLKSGTEVDAAVSCELIRNIFFPKAPLHDGAVIVRNARIIGAGCVLPLSDNLNISKDLGTRHRAAIGVSEHTDAVAAVVSEENGAISVAVGGMLKRNLSLETLDLLLRSELVPTEKSGRRRSGALSRNRKGGGDDVA